MASTGYVEFNSQRLRRTSPPDNRYNCIAWAAEDASRWWWCEGHAYWPPSAPKECTIPAFIEAFAVLGYEECGDGRLEPGFKKIAIYASGGRPKHAARQLATGAWTSKLGRDVDVQHDLADLEGFDYGSVVKFMRKKRAA